MGTAAVWRAILLRVLWFLVAAVALLLGVLVIVQRSTGASAPAAGTDYRTTVLSLSPVAASDPAGADGTRCRLTVDPAGAPDASDAPTRVRSSSPCTSLPQPGSAVGLTFVDEGTTVVTSEGVTAGEPPSLALAIALLVVGGVAAVLFVRANRAFSRALDEIGPPPGDSSPGSGPNR